MPRVAKAPNLTRESVIEAAAVVLEREGHAGLTMRAVAAQLKVQAPALYWYFDDKQALELALYDHLMSDLTFTPKGEDWRADVRTMGQGLRRRLISRRDLGRLPPTGFFFAPNAMALMDVALGVFLSAGMAPRDAFMALTTAIDYVTTWARAEEEMQSRSPNRPGVDEAAKQALFDGSYPNLALAAQGFLTPVDIDEHFNFGLETLIAGFERLIP